MITKKKTMYEMLEVSPNASYAEIKSAFQILSDKLHGQRNEQNGEDVDYRLRLINVAYHTLSVPASRDAYDAQLAAAKPPAAITQLPAVNVLALKDNAEAMSLRADAMLLRADAIALRADALTIKSGVTPLLIEEGKSSPFNTLRAIFGSMGSPFRRLLIMLGTFTAIGMVLQVVFLLAANDHANLASQESSKAEEKIFIQEYYQETGVRVGSRAEAELLEAEKRRKESEQRTAERTQTRSEDEYRRFVEDSRRRGEEVSAEVRQAEAEARREEERRQQQLQEEKRRQEEAEFNRIEREKAKWSRSGYPPANEERYQSSGGNEESSD